MSKSLIEIGLFLEPKVKELAFDDIFHFLMDLVSDGKRLANDKEVSEILYEAIEYSGLDVPSGLNTSKFTIEGLLIIVDVNFIPSYSKDSLAIEFGIHKQTFNKWLETFNYELYVNLEYTRQLSFSQLYMIIVALGFNKSKCILSRKELSERCNLKSNELKRELPNELLIPYEKFIKYPPIFSNQILDFFDVDLL